MVNWYYGWEVFGMKQEDLGMLEMATRLWWKMFLYRNVRAGLG